MCSSFFRVRLPAVCSSFLSCVSSFLLSAFVSLLATTAAIAILISFFLSVKSFFLAYCLPFILSRRLHFFFLAIRFSLVQHSPSLSGGGCGGGLRERPEIGLDLFHGKAHVEGGSRDCSSSWLSL